MADSAADDFCSCCSCGLTGDEAAAGAVATAIADATAAAAGEASAGGKCLATGSCSSAREQVLFATRLAQARVSGAMKELDSVVDVLIDETASGNTVICSSRKSRTQALVATTYL